MIPHVFTLCIFFALQAEQVFASTWVMYNVAAQSASRSAYSSYGSGPARSSEELISLIDANALAEAHKDISKKNVVEYLLLDRDFFVSTLSNYSSSSTASAAATATASTVVNLSSDSIQNTLSTLYEDELASHPVKSLPGFVETFCKRLIRDVPVELPAEYENPLFERIKAVKFRFSASYVVIMPYYPFNAEEDKDFKMRLTLSFQLTNMIPTSIPELQAKSHKNWLSIVDTLSKKTAASSAQKSSTSTTSTQKASNSEDNPTSKPLSNMSSAATVETEESLLVGDSKSSGKSSKKKKNNKGKKDAAVAAVTTTSETSTADFESTSKVIEELANEEAEKKKKEKLQKEKAEANRLRQIELNKARKAQVKADQDRKAQEDLERRQEQSLRDRKAHELKVQTENEERDKKTAELLGGLRIRREAEEKARNDALEEKARNDALEEKARNDALEEKARNDALEEKARNDALEEKARNDALEEKARNDALEEKARKDALEEKARKDALEEKARNDALEEKARKDALEELRLKTERELLMRKQKEDQLKEQEAERKNLGTAKQQKIDPKKLEKRAERARLIKFKADVQAEKDRLVKMETDRLAKIEEDRLAKIKDKAEKAKEDAEDERLRIAEELHLMKLQREKLQKEVEDLKMEKRSLINTEDNQTGLVSGASSYVSRDSQNSHHSPLLNPVTNNIVTVHQSSPTSTISSINVTPLQSTTSGRFNRLPVTQSTDLFDDSVLSMISLNEPPRSNDPPGLSKSGSLKPVATLTDAPSTTNLLFDTHSSPLSSAHLGGAPGGSIGSHSSSQDPFAFGINLNGLSGRTPESVASSNRGTGLLFGLEELLPRSSDDEHLKSQFSPQQPQSRSNESFFSGLNSMENSSNPWSLFSSTPSIPSLPLQQQQQSNRVIPNPLSHHQQQPRSNESLFMELNSMENSSNTWSLFSSTPNIPPPPSHQQHQQSNRVIPNPPLHYHQQPQQLNRIQQRNSQGTDYHPFPSQNHQQQNYRTNSQRPNPVQSSYNVQPAENIHQRRFSPHSSQSQPAHYAERQTAHLMHPMQQLSSYGLQQQQQSYLSPQQQHQNRHQQPLFSTPQQYQQNQGRYQEYQNMPSMYDLDDIVDEN